MCIVSIDWNEFRITLWQRVTSVLIGTVQATEGGRIMLLVLRRNDAPREIDIPVDGAEPRDREILEGLKVAGIALGVAFLAGLLSATGGIL